MSQSKGLDRQRTIVGNFRKSLVNVLDEVEKEYDPTASETTKAALLDRLMVVKSNMEKEFQNAVLSRN